KLPYSVRQRCTVKPNLLRVPQVLHHKAKDLDYVQIRDADGKRRPIYLGKHGSAAAARRHREVLADLLAGKKVAAVRTREEQSNWPTVAALAFAFLQHAQRYYVDADGNRSRSIDNFAAAFEPLLRLYRDLPTDRFRVADMERVREELVAHEFGHER